MIRLKSLHLARSNLVGSNIKLKPHSSSISNQYTMYLTPKSRTCMLWVKKDRGEKVFTISRWPKTRQQALQIASTKIRDTKSTIWVSIVSAFFVIFILNIKNFFLFSPHLSILIKWNISQWNTILKYFFSKLG